MTVPDTRIGREGVEEANIVERSSLFHEAVEVQWRIRVMDNHRQNLSFSDVHPVDITVQNLDVDVDLATTFGDALKVKLKKPKVGDVEGDVVRRKKILKDVSANFPAGSLTAIIGGSGSGKVCLTPTYPPHVSLPFP